jgi:hypothetical protein
MGAMAQTADGEQRTGPTLLGVGTAYVLVEVSDGFQIWDRQDYFATTPRGCPRHYHPLTGDGADAARRLFDELEPGVPRAVEARPGIAHA